MQSPSIAPIQKNSKKKSRSPRSHSLKQKAASRSKILSTLSSLTPSSISQTLLNFNTLSRSEKLSFLKMLWYIYYYDPKTYQILSNLLLRKIEKKIFRQLGVEEFTEEILDMIDSGEGQPTKFGPMHSPTFRNPTDASSKKRPDFNGMKEKLPMIRKVECKPVAHPPTKFTSTQVQRICGKSVEDCKENLNPNLASRRASVVRRPVNQIRDRKIFEEDLNDLKFRKVVTENYFCYFQKYLLVKQNQMDKDILKSTNVLAFLFEPVVSRNFCGGNYSKAGPFHIQRAKNAMELSELSIRRIFLDHDLISLTFQSEAEGFKISLFDPKRSTIHFFDPLRSAPETKKTVLERYQNISLNFLRDLCQSSTVELNVFAWSTQSVPNPGVERVIETGLLCCHFLHESLKGAKLISFEESKINTLVRNMISISDKTLSTM